MSPQVETTFHFAQPWAFALLLLIPLLAVLKGRKGRSAAVVFSSLHLLNQLSKETRSRAGSIRMALFYLTLACLTVAFVRPQIVNAEQSISESGIELILAIDVSRSMLVSDFRIGGRPATRLQAAKKVTREFIRGRKTDRIGVVAFAGQPYLASPITLDHDWIERNMNRVEIGLVEDGTAIGSAIAAAARRLDKRPAKSKVIVLLTDGVNNSGNLTPVTAAKLAKTLGIKIYAIAVGTYGNYVIPSPTGPQYLQQEFDEETLKEVASIADGDYFRAQDTDALTTIFDQIDKLEKTEVRQRVTITSQELFQWFAAAALALGLISLVSGETFLQRIP